MNEHDEIDSWKALQLELGLSPAEEAPRVREQPARAAERQDVPMPDLTRAAGPVASASKWHEARTATTLEEAKAPEPQLDEPVFGAGIATDFPSASEVDEENNVEVGEAPEELPEPEADPEPADEGDKRRRRRRRRRGRRERTDGVDEGAESAAEAANGAPPGELADTDDELADDPDAADDGEDEEEEIEPIVFTDWNVPTWNELIASLYRPER